jgi:hypothetical protein
MWLLIALLAEGLSSLCALLILVNHFVDAENYLLSLFRRRVVGETQGIVLSDKALRGRGNSIEARAPVYHSIGIGIIGTSVSSNSSSIV